MARSYTRSSSRTETWRRRNSNLCILGPPRADLRLDAAQASVGVYPRVRRCRRVFAAAHAAVADQSPVSRSRSSAVDRCRAVASGLTSSAQDQLSDEGSSGAFSGVRLAGALRQLAASSSGLLSPLTDEARSRYSTTPQLDRLLQLRRVITSDCDCRRSRRGPGHGLVAGESGCLDNFNTQRHQELCLRPYLRHGEPVER